jgi:hypothetical protein
MARWLDPAWVFETLSAAETGTVPYFPLAGPGGRVRWSWPLRMGFLTEELRDDLYDEVRGIIAALTEPEVGPSRCDVLLVSANVADAGEILEEEPSAVPEATLALLLDVRRQPEDPRPLPILASHLSAWGAAVIRIPTTRAEWFRTFVTHLSHASALLQSLRGAGGVAALFAAPALAEAAPLPDATSTLTARMHSIDKAFDEAAGALPLPPPTMRVLG